MKKYFLPLALLLAVITGCSDDDDNATVPEIIVLDDDEDIDNEDSDDDTATAIIRILEVDAVNDQVVLTNLGDGSLEIGDFFMCLGPGTYAQISSLTADATDIAPNATITLDYDMNPTADGLSIFTTSSFSTVDPSILLDYVQWGSGNQPRVDQAVTAGRWDDTANFVADGSPYTFIGTDADVGSSFWEGTEVPPAEGVMRILNVNTDTDEVTLANLGEAAIDVGNYFLCLGPGTYVQINSVANGSTVLSANEVITLPYDMDPTQDGLSIFATNDFESSDPSVLLDFVQWGAGSQPRASQAVSAGRWGDVGNFVTGPSPYIYVGGATEVGVNFWE